MEQIQRQSNGILIILFGSQILHFLCCDFCSLDDVYHHIDHKCKTKKEVFFRGKIPGANVITLFTKVIYCHSMVIPSFCVIKLYYLGNYHGMAVNYHGIKLFYNIGQKSVL